MEVHLSNEGQQVHFTSYAKDKFIAPFMSQFTDADIPDMSQFSSEASCWISNFILNSMLLANLKDPKRQFVFNFLRRAEAAYEQYELARTATREFLSGTRQSASRYMKAVLHWEVFLAHAWQGYVLLGRILDQKKIFNKGTLTREEKLNRLYNDSKHAESRIEQGKMPKHGTIPVWLTKEGLQSHNTGLSFVEAAEILEDLGKWATLLQDPRTFAEQPRAEEFSDDGEAP
jgi:hypothetical protein